MLHFNRNDIHEWNISKEAFDAMIKDYGFKVDESKISIEALYTNALANFRNDTEKTFKFLKQEKSTAEEIRDRSFEEKTKMENFFINALMIEVAKLIDETAVKIQVHAAHLKRAYLEFNDYMVRKSQEQESKVQANIALQEAGLKLMQERQMALDAYMDAAGDRLSNLLAKADALRAQGRMLDAQYAELLKDVGKKMAKEIDELRDENGEPYLKGVPQQEKEEYLSAATNALAVIEVQEEKKIEEAHERISHIDAELEHLKKMKQDKKASVPFPGHNGALPSFTGLQNTLSVQEKIDKYEQEKAVLLGYIQNAEPRLLELQQAAIVEIGRERGISAEASRLPLGVIKATDAYQEAIPPLKGVIKAKNANIDAVLEADEKAMTQIEHIRQDISEIRREIKDLDKLIQLEEQMAKMQAYTADKKADMNESRRVHASH